MKSYGQWITASWLLLMIGPIARSQSETPSATQTGTAEWSESRRELEALVTARKLVEECAVEPAGRFIAYTTWARDRPGAPAPTGMFPSHASRRERFRLHLHDLKTGDESRVGDRDQVAMHPAWSPDGRRLAFIGLHEAEWRLGVRDVEGGQLQWVGDPVHPNHLDKGIVWCRGGREVIATVRDSSDPLSDAVAVSPTEGPSGPGYEASDVIEDTSGREGDTSRWLDSFSDWNASVAARIDIVSGETVSIGKDLRWTGPEAFAISPSGLYIQARKYALIDPGLLELDDAGSGEARINGLDAATWRDRSVRISARWHPREDLLALVGGDGVSVCSRGERGVWSAEHLCRLPDDIEVMELAFTRMGDHLVVPFTKDSIIQMYSPSWASLRATHIRIVQADGLALNTIALEDERHGLRLEHLLCSRDGELWQPDSTQFHFVGFDESSHERVVVRCDLDGGNLEVVERGQFHLTAIGAPEDHSFLVARLEAPDLPPDLFRFRGSIADAMRITTVDEGLLDNRVDVRWVSAEVEHPTSEEPTLIRASVVTYREPEATNEEVPALLGDKREESGTRRPSPAVMHVYGGSDVSLEAFRYCGGSVGGIPARLFLQRGLAVVHVDVLMGPEREPGEPVDAIESAVLALLDQISEARLIDPARVGLMGTSYGGYSTAAILSRSKRFRAGVAMAGLYDLPGFSVSPGMFGNGNFFAVETQGRLPRRFWESRDQYLRNSPFYEASQIDSPLLLIHGEDDLTCSVIESQKLFGVLKELGRDAQLAVYPGEDHFLETWSADHFRDACGRAADFLDRYLKGGSRLHGRVTLDGEPAQGHYLHVWWKNQAVPIARVADDGTFDFGVLDLFEGTRFNSAWLGDMEAAEKKLLLQGSQLLLGVAPGKDWKAGNTLCTIGPIQLEDGVDREVMIDLEATIVRGHLLGPGDAPATERTLTITWSPEEPPKLVDGSTFPCEVTTTTDADGSFEFGRVPYGRYRLESAGRDCGFLVIDESLPSFVEVRIVG